ncbi:MAG TPA: heavy-metal-associated domain-containing protein [Oligoflexus sp.]|uniref:heavy-metal-associated domain-containing protein n=1 Tax=Oligoflexus sp. TaxID=1971216 RepID=UPI002D34CF16|nr:heavy-metal-associated domain-containing protein [Oligoflexus sp.]HYX33482.1 heavy-metal-associated domain-containing protein [Oligoflexus sp.]
MYEFKVEGMSCGHCIQTITKTLNNLDQSAKVVADLASQTIKVESVQDPKLLAAEIEDAGYIVVSTRTL